MKQLPEWIHKTFGYPYRLHTTSSGEGTPLVLLHGLAGSSANWQSLVEKVDNSYACHSLDILGFGQSAKPVWASYDPDMHIKHIRYTLRRAGIKKPFILAGHSLGSLLALRYAALYPKDVKRLFLLSPPIYKSNTESKKRTYRRFIESLYDRLYRRLRTHKRATLEAARRLRRFLPDHNNWMLDEATWLPFARSLEKCIENQDPFADLRKVSVPIDIFYGSRDRLLSAANIKAINEKNVTTHRLDLGHSFDKKYADAVAKVLSEDPAP